MNTKKVLESAQFPKNTWSQVVAISISCNKLIEELDKDFHMDLGEAQFLFGICLKEIIIYCEMQGISFGKMVEEYTTNEPKEYMNLFLDIAELIKLEHTYPNKRWETLNAAKSIKSSFYYKIGNLYDCLLALTVVHDFDPEISLEVALKTNKL